jgi:hypothetical protein
LADALRARYGEAVVAILVYGSCFWRHTDEGLVDLYVIVDNLSMPRCRVGAAMALHEQVTRAPFGGHADRAARLKFC